MLLMITEPTICAINIERNIQHFSLYRNPQMQPIEVAPIVIIGLIGYPTNKQPKTSLSPPVTAPAVGPSIIPDNNIGRFSVPNRNGPSVTDRSLPIALIAINNPIRVILLVPFFIFTPLSDIKEQYSYDIILQAK